jgi:hypothetical protein
MTVYAPIKTRYWSVTRTNVCFRNIIRVMAGLLACVSLRFSAFPVSQWPRVKNALRLQLREQPRTRHLFELR